MASIDVAVSRDEAVRFQPGRDLWVRGTGERVSFKWITLTGVRVATSAGDVTMPESALCTRVPVLGPEPAAPEPRPARKTTRKRVQRGRTAKRAAQPQPAPKTRARNAPGNGKPKREKMPRLSRGFSCVQCGHHVGLGEHALARHLIKHCKAIPSASLNVDWDARGLH